MNTQRLTIRTGLTIKVLLSKNYVPLLWSNTKSSQHNWGDLLNTYLIKQISGRQPIHSAKIIKLKGIKVYSAIGSILDYLSTPNVEVWGSGFRSSISFLKQKPLKIYAVRGDLTRERLEKYGLQCPKIYGDPALLIPRFYNPEIKQEYELGIIPHYIDKKCLAIKKIQKKFDIKIIDIESGIYKFIDELKSCKHIASSSLHGLIASDAYGIPSAWIKLSDNILGGDFKFLDYFSSVGRTEKNPLIVDETTSIPQIMDSLFYGSIQIDLDKLLEVCPFKK